MKLFKAINKNFKILFRKKSSILTIILGPLLIMLVLALTFGTTTNIKISLGYVAPDDSTLTKDFVTSLNENYLSKQYILKEDCISELERGLLHACIVFPPNLELGNNKTNDIYFIVDKSRISIVYSVIDSISKNIEVKTDQLSKNLTEVIIETLISTDNELDKTLALLIQTKSISEGEVDNSDNLIDSVNIIEEKIKELDISNLDKSVEDLEEYIDDISSNVDTKTSSSFDIVENIRDITADPAIEGYLDEIQDDLESIEDTTNDNTNKSDAKLSYILTTIDKIDDNIELIESKIASSSSLTLSQKTNLVKLKSNIEEIRSQILGIQNNIRNIEITSSSNIVNPINTKIETISTEDNRLLILFPYAIMLVIMFSSLMLSSTLIILEKSSNAAFRTFTTPTRDEFFIFANYLTAFIIVLTQIAVILGAVNYFLVDIMLGNIGVNIVLLLLSISLFIMIGMAIGYLLKTQQSANMAAISIGVILLFVSNIIFPLESLSSYAKILADFNPFVMTSELMRKSILFEVDFNIILAELLILFGYSIALLIIIIIVQKLSKTKYFNNLSFLRSKVNRFTKEFIELNDERVLNREELIDELRKMDEDTYKLYIKKNYKEFKNFLIDVLDEKKFGNLKKIKKEKLIENLIKREEDAKKRITKNKDDDKLISNKINKDKKSKESDKDSDDDDDD